MYEQFSGLKAEYASEKVKMALGFNNVRYIFKARLFFLAFFPHLLQLH